MSGFELTERPAGLARARLSGALVVAAGLVAGTVLGLLVVALLSLRLLGFQALTVASDSMAPALKAGDLIIVKPASIGSIEPGDVVLFASGGDRIPTVHRVLGVNEYETIVRGSAGGERSRYVDYGLVTGGDANPAPDAREVSAEQLIGTVWFTVPGGGALAGLPMNAIFAGLAIAVVVAWMAWELKGRGERRGHSHIGAVLVFGAVMLATASGASLSSAVAWTVPAATDRGAAMVVQLEMRHAPNDTEDERPLEAEPASRVQPTPVAGPTAAEASDAEVLGDVAPAFAASEPEFDTAEDEATPVAGRPVLPEERQPPDPKLPTREPQPDRQESPPARR